MHVLAALALSPFLLVPPSAGPVAGAGPDLSRLVVLGDSLSAGYRNGSLIAWEQTFGYAQLLAERAGTDLALPLIATPGIPNALALVDPGPPPVIEPMGGASIGRLYPSVQTFDLAVPGHDVADALRTRPDLAFDDLTDLVLGLPGLLGGISWSQVEWAEALVPTTAIVWLGSNDVLGAAVGGGTAGATPVSAFAASYDEVVARVRATGASLVLANVPDVTVVPYFTSAEELADSIGLPLSVIGPLLGIAAGDHVLPEAFALVPPILAGQAPGPLPAEVVLDAAEAATLRNLVDGYNAHVRARALAVGAAHVDVHGLLSRLDADGAPVDGATLTTDFLGGLFSLDGIHPTRTGSAILANEFARAMNSQLGAQIEDVPVDVIAKQDPLVIGHSFQGNPASIAGILKLPFGPGQ